MCVRWVRPGRDQLVWIESARLGSALFGSLPPRRCLIHSASRSRAPEHQLHSALRRSPRSHWTFQHKSVGAVSLWVSFGGMTLQSHWAVCPYGSVHSVP